MSRPRRSAGAPTIVIALGGNALQPPDERGEIHEQFAHTRESLGAIVALAEAGWRIAIVHGNGPQIGDELLRNEMASSVRPPLPLGVLVAATAGWIGYMIQQSLQNALDRRGVPRSVVTLVTQIVVDPDDPAFDRPTKPIGHSMSPDAAHAMSEAHGWTVAQHAGGWRRVVPSPVPRAIVEAGHVRGLLEEQVIVIAAGGGGTPVYRDATLGLEGVDAVVDKDRAAAVLAGDLGAETLLILTNVEGVYAGYGGPRQKLLRSVRLEELDALDRAGEFGEGTMRPKVEAAGEFVRRGGRRAIIARLDQGLTAVHGEAGTTIVR